MQYPLFNIFVFSFNRGQFLKNCLNSIEKANLVGADVFIIDDNSTDRATVDILNWARGCARFKVRFNESGAAEFKTGGLCGSMNLALDISRALGSPYALFMQDDMQFVRPFFKADLRRLQAYFDGNLRSLQCSVCYYPLEGHYNRGAEMRDDPSGWAWVRRSGFETGKTGFSDVGFFAVDRVVSELGEFHAGEEVNSQRCLEQGLYRGLYKTPFMHWLPFPTSFRGGRRSLSHAALERICGAGFHPYRFNESCERAPKVCEWADQAHITEMALCAPSAPHSRFWSVTGGVSQVIARGGWRLRGFEMVQRARSVVRG